MCPGWGGARIPSGSCDTQNIDLQETYLPQVLARKTCKTSPSHPATAAPKHKKTGKKKRKTSIFLEAASKILFQLSFRSFQNHTRSIYYTRSSRRREGNPIHTNENPALWRQPHTAKKKTGTRKKKLMRKREKGTHPSHASDLQLSSSWCKPSKASSACNVEFPEGLRCS